MDKGLKFLKQQTYLCISQFRIEVLFAICVLLNTEDSDRPALIFAIEFNSVGAACCSEFYNLKLSSNNVISSTLHYQGFLKNN